MRDIVVLCVITLHGDVSSGSAEGLTPRRESTAKQVVLQWVRAPGPSTYIGVCVTLGVILHHICVRMRASMCPFRVEHPQLCGQTCEDATGSGVSTDAAQAPVGVTTAGVDVRCCAHCLLLATRGGLGPRCGSVSCGTHAQGEAYGGEVRHASGWPF